MLESLDNFVRKLWGQFFEKESPARFLKVQIVDKLYLGANFTFPYVFYLENLKPEEEMPGANKHNLVAMASELDISMMDWFRLAIGSKWEVKLQVVNGKLRLRYVMWQVNEGET